ncbi:hypothetical protein L5515_012235 [Caenorhabditis briggsae]|uniref:Sdz-33 F-box domain-containing protein n=1 Tax=Caenorhabditis briggsae TaxID=6238 RepID=A0AAE9EXN8_CAEBR|nr:hypothetical protein L5515_012235 [Caenorhabditis briggsae]
MVSVPKFPYVVFREILANCNASVLSALSNTSRHFNNNLIRDLPRNMFKIKISIQMMAMLETSKGDTSESFFIPYLDCDRLDLKDILESAMFSFSNDSLASLTVSIDGMTRFLKCDIDSLIIDCGHCIGMMPQILGWLNERQQSINELIIKYEAERDVEDLDYFLKNMNVVESFVIYVDTLPDGMRPLHPKFKCDFLSVTDHPSNNWMSLKDISNSDCKHIQLDTSEFTPTEWNTFLKSWKNGSNQRMEYITANIIESEDMMIELTDGLNVVEREESLIRTFVFVSTPCAFFGGLDIKREDEKVASVVIGPIMHDHDDGKQIRALTVVVWPEGTN